MSDARKRQSGYSGGTNGPHTAVRFTPVKLSSLTMRDPTTTAAGSHQAPSPDSASTVSSLQSPTAKVARSNGFTTGAVVDASLPIVSVTAEIVAEVVQNDTILLLGETGSGKTTQVPRILYQNLNKVFPKGAQPSSAYLSGMIACTQPRRVAACSVAARVADEMNVDLGKLVGYAVRFNERVAPGQTRIKYMTDGMLEREAMFDPLLSRYCIVILDEVHERSVMTDVLLMIVKQAQRRRRADFDRNPAAASLAPLKVIMMSAAMDVDKLRDYFTFPGRTPPPVLFVEGRAHPIEYFYTTQLINDYVTAVVKLIIQLHGTLPISEHMLVFMTGQEEICRVIERVNHGMDVAKEKLVETRPIELLPMYANLSLKRQLRVLKFNSACADDTRRVVVSTNVAETSVTIPGISVVIDCGRVKSKQYEQRGRLDQMVIRLVSKFEAWQRAGRSGRLGPGKCYRLYREVDYSSFKQAATPEILNSNPLEIALHLLELQSKCGGTKTLFEMDYLDAPSDEAMLNALEHLRWMNAVETPGGCVVKRATPVNVTALGKQLWHYPVDPRLAKTLVAAARLGCYAQVIDVISCLSAEPIYQVDLSLGDDPTQAAKADPVRNFHDVSGDHVTMLKIFNAFMSSDGKRAKWCDRNNLHFRNLASAAKIRQQLVEIFDGDSLMKGSDGQVVTKEGLQSEALRESFCAGYFANVAYLLPDGSYRTVLTNTEVAIHPTSCLFRKRPQLVLYYEVVRSTKNYIRYVSEVSADWLRPYMERVGPQFVGKLSTPS